MTESFLPEADEEFREAARYYENECPGLGLRARPKITSHFHASIHPAWLRCSSVK